MTRRKRKPPKPKAIWVVCQRWNPLLAPAFLVGDGFLAYDSLIDAREALVKRIAGRHRMQFQIVRYVPAVRR